MADRNNRKTTSCFVLLALLLTSLALCNLLTGSTRIPASDVFTAMISSEEGMARKEY